MNVRRLKELPCESTPIYSGVFLEKCGVVSSCARRRKRRDPVLRRQKAKNSLRNSLKTDCGHLLSTPHGSYEKSETEDLVKLDGRNLMSCWGQSHQTAQSTGVSLKGFS